MCSDEEGDRGNEGSDWDARGLLGGQQVDPMAEGGVGHHWEQSTEAPRAASSRGLQRTCPHQKDLVLGDEDWGLSFKLGILVLKISGQTTEAGLLIPAPLGFKQWQVLAEQVKAKERPNKPYCRPLTGKAYGQDLALGTCGNAKLRGALHDYSWEICRIIIIYTKVSAQGSSFKLTNIWHQYKDTIRIK